VVCANLDLGEASGSGGAVREGVVRDLDLGEVVT
jgi:hypothetical protein